MRETTGVSLLTSFLHMCLRKQTFCFQLWSFLSFFFMILNRIHKVLYSKNSLSFNWCLHRNVQIFAICNVCISAMLLFCTQTCPGFIPISKQIVYFSDARVSKYWVLESVLDALLQITNVWSVRIQILYLMCKTSHWNAYTKRHCGEKQQTVQWRSEAGSQENLKQYHNLILWLFALSPVLFLSTYTCSYGFPHPDNINWLLNPMILQRLGLCVTLEVSAKANLQNDLR